MEHNSSRAYHRRKRKMACRYCNARHIRCKMPELPNANGETTGQFGPRPCQACLDANRECELETRSIAVNEQLSCRDASRVLAAHLEVSSTPDQRQGSTTSEISLTQLPEQRIDNSSPNASPRLTEVPSEPRYAPHLKGIPPEEGSEMLLVRLTDVRNQEAGGEPSRMATKVVYFGDESVWSDSLREARNSKAGYPANPQSLSAQSENSNIHYTVPPALKDQPQDVPRDDLSLKQEETLLLQKKGAFSLPPPDIQNKLLDSFFSWLYPLQPILDKGQFMNDFHSGQAPIILLQALLFAATTCCDESVIIQYWPSRRSAQAALYKRVKARYDADHEQNRVTIVQVLFLMCFWWGSPTDNKDFSHWLAASIHLAQVMGMHRSTKDSRLSAKDRKLWKRIWWTLYVRDHFDAASVGRPMIINDDDCDVEPLHETDFECDENGTPPPGAGHCIELTNLATLIGRAVRAGRARKNNKVSDDPRVTIDIDLSAWEARLPERLRYHEEERNPQAKLFASMLMLGLHFCKIVLHRKCFLDSRSNNESSSIAPSSANAVTRVVEGLLTDGLLTRAQVHLIAVIFASFTIHIVSMQRSYGTRRRVLQHKAKLCLLSLAEFREYWPFVDWMYRLFSNLLHQLEAGDELSKGHSQRSWKTPLRPDTNLPTSLPADLINNTTEIGGHDDTTMSLPVYEQDAGSRVDVQPGNGAHHHFMSGIFTSENFLDPFMPLDNLDWYDFDAVNLADLNGNDMPWTGTPLPSADK